MSLSSSSPSFSFYYWPRAARLRESCTADRSQAGKRTFKLAMALALISAGPGLAEGPFLERDDTGQIDVNTDSIAAAVSECADWYLTAPHSVIESQPRCAGRVSDACMDEDADWGYSTTGMYFCTISEAYAWEAEVEKAAQLLEARFAEDDAFDRGSEGAEGVLPYRVPSLLQAQEKWTQSRDADCLVEYLEWRGGTGAKVLGAGCQLEANHKRFLWLVGQVRTEN